MTTFLILAWLVSTLITLWHTADELASPGGPIWSYLTGLLSAEKRPPEWLSALGYFVFQAANAGLAVAWLLGYGWALPVLAGIRVVDILVTHTLLPRIKSPNPGEKTCLLLLWDVGVLAIGLIWGLG